MRIHSSVRFGTLASFHLVDDRQYRDPQACTRGGRAGVEHREPGNAAPSGRTRSARCSAQRRKRWLDDAFAHGSNGLERRRPANAVRTARFPVRTGPIVLERRLGRLPGCPRPHDRIDAQAHARQSRSARRRRASELGGPREGRLRRSRKSLDRRGILRDEHHRALRRWRQDQRSRSRGIRISSSPTPRTAVTASSSSRRSA